MAKTMMAPKRINSASALVFGASTDLPFHLCFVLVRFWGPKAARTKGKQKLHQIGVFRFGLDQRSVMAPWKALKMGLMRYCNTVRSPVRMSRLVVMPDLTKISGARGLCDWSASSRTWMR